MSGSSVITDFIGRGLHADRPNPPPIATGTTAIYYETDTDSTFVWDGSTWQGISSGGGGATEEIDHNGTLVASRSKLNLIDGPNVALTVADNVGTSSVDVTVASKGNMNWTGNWDGSIVYAVDDVVTDNGISYICTAPVTLLPTYSEAVLADLPKGYWPLTEAGTPGPPIPGGYSSAFLVHVDNISGDPIGGSTTVPVPTGGTDYVIECVLTGSDAAAVVAGAIDTTNFTDVAMFYNNTGTWQQIDIDYDITTNGVWNSSNVTLWFKLQSSLAAGAISPNSGNGAYLLCYGHSSPTVKRDWDNIYPFSDDFPGSSLDVSKWTSNVDTGSTLTVSGGSLTIACSSGVTGDTYITSIPQYGVGYVMTSSATCPLLPPSSEFVSASWRNGATTPFIQATIEDSATPNVGRFMVYVTGLNFTSIGTNDGSSHLHRVARDSTGYGHGNWDNSPWVSIGGTEFTTDPLSAQILLDYHDNMASGASIDTDWIKVRPWVSDEPTTSVTVYTTTPDTIGTVYADATGNGYDLTTSVGTMTHDTGAVPGTTALISPDAPYQDALVTTNTLGLPVNGDPYTLEGWVKPQKYDSWMGWIAYGPLSYSSFFIGSDLRSPTGGGPTEIETWDPSNTVASSPMLPNIQDAGGWHYLTITDNASGTVKFYYDGTLYSTQSVDPSNGLVYDPANVLAIGDLTTGGTPITEGYTGGLSQMAIYPSALSEAQVANHFFIATSLINRHPADDSTHWQALSGVGNPVLRGPYVVDYTDIATVGAVKILWIPKVGDVLLRLFPDMANVVQWDQNSILEITQQGKAGIALATAHNIGLAFSTPNFGTLDSIADALSGETYDPVNGNPTSVGATVFHTTDPVIIKLRAADADPGQGHVELYTLIAKAIAP